MRNIIFISVFISFIINKVEPHLAICQIFLYTLPFLLSADAYHVNRDQVDSFYAKEASQHPVTVPGLMMAPLSNIEKP